MMRNFVRDWQPGDPRVFVATFVYSTSPWGRSPYGIPWRLRAPSFDRRRGGAPARRRLGSHLLHPPHREVDPAARGHRGDSRDLTREIDAESPSSAASGADTCRRRRDADQLAELAQDKPAWFRRSNSGYLQFVATHSGRDCHAHQMRSSPHHRPATSSRREAARDGLAAEAARRRPRARQVHVTARTGP